MKNFRIRAYNEQVALLSPDASCLSVLSFNSTKRRTESFTVSYIKLHSIILASCKPGWKPGRRFAWACRKHRKHIESRSQASCKLASNLLQTKLMLAAMKKRGNNPHGLNSISETDTDMMRIALCFQKWKPVIWVDMHSNFRMDVGAFCVP